jgi:hypothetical protein
VATLTPNSVSTSGTITYTAASAGGDSVAVGSRTSVALVVRNASGGSINVTVAGAVPCSQGTTHTFVTPCPVGDTEVNIPSYCVSPSTGLAAVTYSATTSITVAAVSN